MFLAGMKKRGTFISTEGKPHANSCDHVLLVKFPSLLLLRLCIVKQLSVYYTSFTGVWSKAVFFPLFAQVDGQNINN